MHRESPGDHGDATVQWISAAGVRIMGSDLEETERIAMLILVERGSNAKELSIGAREKVTARTFDMPHLVNEQRGDVQ